MAVVLGWLRPTSSASPQQTEEQRKALCSVDGRVISAADGTALKSAQIALMPERKLSRKDPFVATSDAKGHFFLKDVVPGRYEFIAIHVGYVTQHFKPEGGPDQGVILTLAPGQKLEDVLFRMKRASVISGRVINEDGEPIVGVPVTAERRETEEERDEEGPVSASHPELAAEKTTITDDRGEYRLFGLRSTEYYVQVGGLAEPDRTGGDGSSYWVEQALGSEYGLTYYPGVSQIAQAQVIPLKPGDEVQADVTVHRVKSVEVAGRVRGLTAPAKHALLSLEPAEQDATTINSSYQDSADENGLFRIKGVPSGSYVLRVYQAEDPGSEFSQSAQQKLEVADSNIEDLEIVLGAGSNFTGRIAAANPREQLDLERSGLQLISTDVDNPEVRNARLKKDGTFEVKSLSEGLYSLQLWNVGPPMYIKSARVGNDDILETGLRVEKGAPGGHIEIALSSSCAQLEGAVYYEDKLQPGSKVRITPDPKTRFNRFRSRSATTDQAGRFSVVDLAPGKYVVVAEIAGASERDALKSDPQSVTLVERGHTAVELRVPKPQSN